MSNELFGEEFETTVKKFGNSGHVILPQGWIGKRVRIVIFDMNDKYLDTKRDIKKSGSIKNK